MKEVPPNVTEFRSCEASPSEFHLNLIEFRSIVKDSGWSEIFAFEFRGQVPIPSQRIPFRFPSTLNEFPWYVHSSAKRSLYIFKESLLQLDVKESPLYIKFSGSLFKESPLYIKFSCSLSIFRKSFQNPYHAWRFPFTITVTLQGIPPLLRRSLSNC